MNVQMSNDEQMSSNWCDHRPGGWWHACPAKRGTGRRDASPPRQAGRRPLRRRCRPVSPDAEYGYLSSPGKSAIAEDLAGAVHDAVDHFETGARFCARRSWSAAGSGAPRRFSGVCVGRPDAVGCSIMGPGGRMPALHGRRDARRYDKSAALCCGGLPGRTRQNSLKLAKTLILKFFLILKPLALAWTRKARALREEKWQKIELQRLGFKQEEEMHLNAPWAAFVRVFLRGAKNLRFTICDLRVEEGCSQGWTDKNNNG